MSRKPAPLGAAGGPVAAGRTGAALALGATAMWPVIEIVGGMLSRSHSPLQTVWLRYAAHVAALVIAVYPRAGRAAFATRHLGLQLSRGVCMFVMPASFLLAASQARVQDVWSVFWFAPVLALVAARFLLGERPGALTIGATVLGLAGALLTEGAGSTVAAALVPGAVMAGSFTGYLVLSQQLRDEALPASLLYTGVGALLPLSFLLPGVWTPVLPGEIWIVGALGGASLLCLVCLDRSIELIGAGLVAPLLYLVLLFEAAFGAVVQGARPGTLGLAGLGVVGLATALALMNTVRASPPEPTAAAPSRNPAR